MIAGRVGEKFFLPPTPTLETMHAPDSDKETGAVPDGLGLELLCKRRVLDNAATGMMTAESTATRILGVPDDYIRYRLQKAAEAKSFTKNLAERPMRSAA